MAPLQEFVAKNEPVYQYLPGSKERNALEEKLKEYESQTFEIPIIIGDQEYTTPDVKYQVRPHDHKRPLAKFYYATSEQINKAIEVSQQAHHDWERMPLEDRCKIFLKVADLISDKYRMDLMAATMLGQSKTIIQAEIDCTCELADFFRFNVQAALELLKWKPISPDGVTNTLVYRGMEGFWAAIAPFNFTAISGNLAGAPALMGNVVLWKPSDTALLASYIVFKIFREAGVPPGVINLIPADGPVFGNTIVSSPLLAGINFTGSSKTFIHLQKQVAFKLDMYKAFPRLVGECGGKNYHFVHASADVENVVNGTVRSAFEFSGQKCSACSRMYVPESMWPKLKERLSEEVAKIKTGDPVEADTFYAAVIDDKSFARIKDYIDYGKSKHKVVTGAEYDDSKGYFVKPTIFESADPKDRLMQEEIFGPVLTVYPYKDQDYKEVLEMINETSQYGLTGAVFATDQKVLEEAHDILRFSAGNFYVNDKSTGSVVCQQPFGGARKSGTNDKAGSPHYVLRFTSPLAIKTSHLPATDWKYPYMGN